MRFNKTQLNDYIAAQQAAKVAAIGAVTSKSDGGGNNTAETVRNALIAAGNIDAVTMTELKRQSFDVSPAEGIIYQLPAPAGAANPLDYTFDLTLNNAGENGIVIDGLATGYELIPILDGAVVPGIANYSIPFDAVTEVGQGSIPNTLALAHGGMVVIGGFVLAEPVGTGGNRWVEIDVCVFKGNGDPEAIVGYSSTGNLNLGRSDTIVVPSTPIQEATFNLAGKSIGLVARKAPNETTPTVLRFTRSTLNAMFTSIDPA